MIKGHQERGWTMDHSLSPRLCMVPSPFQLLHHSWARSIHLLLMGVTDRQTDRQEHPLHGSDHPPPS